MYSWPNRLCTCRDIELMPRVSILTMCQRNSSPFRRHPPRPTSVSGLKSYLGLLSPKYLNNAWLRSTNSSNTKRSGHGLTSKKKHLLNQIKELLLSSQLLVHFDPSLWIRGLELSCPTKCQMIWRNLSDLSLEC